MLNFMGMFRNEAGHLPKDDLNPTRCRYGKRLPGIEDG